MKYIAQVVAEQASRQEQEIRWQPDEFLHERQARVFHSKEPYRCQRVGRRGGKSWGWAAALIAEGFKHRKSTPLYVTTTRQDARDIMDPAFDRLNEKFGLGLVQNKATGDITMPNGSKILLRGAGTLREINKLRGPGYPCVIVDEVQNFGPDLHYLIDEVAEPATGQYHGWIGVSGTPPPSQYGPFWDIDQGDHAHAWEHHHWTYIDNPHLPDPEGFLKRVLNRRGWTEDHPGYQREYLGRWIRDDSARAFDFSAERDVVPHFDTSHALDWHWVMGVDVGYNDPSAYVVLAASRLLGQVYVVDSFEQSEMTTSEAWSEAQRLCDEYPVSEIVIDTGGGGAKMIQKDWDKLTRLPVSPAQKTHKASQVSIINSDFRAGKIKVARDKNMKLINDLMVLEWDSEKKERNKFEYPKGAPDHMPDAFQYAYNVCYHHFRDYPDEKPPKPGTPEYWSKQEDQMEQEQVAQVEQDVTAWDILQESYF